VPADVDAVLATGAAAAVVESPISDSKLDALGVSRGKMLTRIRAAVNYAVSSGLKVAFFGVDSTRADPAFYDAAYSAAVEAGAAEVVVVDTLGVASPELVASLVRRTRKLLPATAIHFHGHNDFGLATPNAISAARAGARWIHGTVNGMGERAGNASIGEVALALRAVYGVDVGIDLAAMRTLSRQVRDKSGCALEPWKPLVGENLFRRESGAVASQFHTPSAIEPYSSDLVGAERGIVLGKKSGLDSIRIKCRELGLSVHEDRHADLLERVKALSIEKRGLVTDTELRMLAREREIDVTNGPRAGR